MKAIRCSLPTFPAIVHKSAQVVVAQERVEAHHGQVQQDERPFVVADGGRQSMRGYAYILNPYAVIGNCRGDVPKNVGVTPAIFPPPSPTLKGAKNPRHRGKGWLPL